MILLASDRVGLQIAEFLINRGERIDWLFLDDADRGGCNDAIRRTVERGRAARIAPAASLAKEAVVAELAAAKPRLGVLAWWPYLLKGPLLTVPQLGWLNLHPGFLPYNRGKHPNFWCLVDGTPCGAALHWIDRGVDTGPVVARATIETCWEDTGETVHRKCRDLAVQLFKDKFDMVRQGQAPALPQGMDEGTAHRSGEIEAASEIHLDERYTARELFNLIRARMFPPHPTAFFSDGGRTYSVRILIEPRQGTPG